MKLSQLNVKPDARIPELGFTSFRSDNFDLTANTELRLVSIVRRSHPDVEPWLVPFEGVTFMKKAPDEVAKKK